MYMRIYVYVYVYICVYVYVYIVDVFPSMYFVLLLRFRSNLLWCAGGLMRHVHLKLYLLKFKTTVQREKRGGSYYSQSSNLCREIAKWTETRFHDKL